MEKSFDATFTLQQLQDTLITEEQLGFKLLTNLTKRDQPPPANIGTFNDDAGAAAPKALLLVDITDGNQATVVADQLTKGHKLICSNHVFVAGAARKVAVFR